MVKKRNKTRSRHSLQVVTLCISTAMVLILIGMVVLRNNKITHNKIMYTKLL